MAIIPARAQNPKAPPETTTNPAAESKITANSKLDGKTLGEWVADIKSTDPSVQRTALKAVVYYGRLARNEAVPAIISVLKNRDRAPEASIKVYGALALGLIGMDEKDLKSGVPCLINMLSDTQAIVRLNAVGALGRLGPDARFAIPHLVNLTRAREDSETRQIAVNALGVMAWDKNLKEGADPRVFRAATEALGDHCIQVRYEALKALIICGPPAIPNDSRGKMAANADRANAIAKLEGLLTHRDKIEVVWAHLALFQMDLPRINDTHPKAIAKFFKAGDSRVRCNAADALSMAWSLAKKVPNPPNAAAITPKTGWGLLIKDLIELLSDKELHVVFCGINALGEFGSAAKSAKPQLEELARHNDPLIQKAANAALEKITDRVRANLSEPTR
jgi:HEAT repeat protein